MESFEYKGTWFVPEFPNQKVAGVLKFDPSEGARLKLIGDGFTKLRKEKGHHADGVIYYPPRLETGIIVGRADDGRSMTLQRCVSAYDVSAWRIARVFVGNSFENEESIAFDEFFVEFADLEVWLNRSGIGQTITNNVATGDFVKLEIVYTPPSEIVGRMDGVTVFFYHMMKTTPTSFWDIRLTQTARMKIEFDALRPYEDCRDFVYQLRMFMMLAMGRAVQILALGGDREDLEFKYPLKNVEIFHSTPGQDRSRSKVRVDDMLFTYHDIADDFGEYLNKWFEIHDQLEPVLDLHFGLYDIPLMYRHTMFLTLAQALETYHRRMYGGTYLSEEEYEPIRQTLVDSIPTSVEKSHRDKLKGSIKYGYEYSLRKRLKLILNECLNDYQEVVVSLVGHKKRQNMFINKLVATRNYLTHYSEDSEAEAITDSNELYRHAQRMKLIMQLCFFKELGFPPELVKKIASRRQFSYWAKG